MVHVEYFSSILWGASEALYEHDMNVVLCPTMHEREREVTLLDRLLQGTTDGALLMLTRESNDALTALERQGYPFVVLDPRQPVDERRRSSRPPTWPARRQQPNICSHSDTVESERSWARTAGSPAVDRLAGYQVSLAAAGVDADPQLIAKGNFTNESGYAGASELLSLRKPPTAIFAFNDEMAVGAMRAAEERGLEIPRDLSIVGFDDVEKTRIVTPALTTVRQPLAEMGRMAVSLLTRLLEQQPIEAMRVELATKLIVRDSTAPPRS